jgi:GntR family phosphonate transport system transcriptional regulator
MFGNQFLLLWRSCYIVSLSTTILYNFMRGSIRRKSAIPGRRKPNSGLTIWRQIESVLEKEILAGTFDGLAPLPNEAELAQRFGVNRHTVRQAMQSLAYRGLVSVQQGRGTFIQEMTVDYLLGRRTRFTENLERQQMQGSHQFLSISREQASKKICDSLKIRADSEVFCLRTLNFANDVRISQPTNYLPCSKFPDFPDRYSKLQSITKVLVSYGFGDYIRMRTRITARMPAPEVADLLQQSPNRPVLRVETIDGNTDGHALKFGITHFAGDRVQFVVENDR